MKTIAITLFFFLLFVQISNGQRITITSDRHHIGDGRFGANSNCAAELKTPNEGSSFRREFFINKENITNPTLVIDYLCGKDADHLPLKILFNGKDLDRIVSNGHNIRIPVPLTHLNLNGRRNVFKILAQVEDDIDDFEFEKVYLEFELAEQEPEILIVQNGFKNGDTIRTSLPFQVEVKFNKKPDQIPEQIRWISYKDEKYGKIPLTPTSSPNIYRTPKFRILSTVQAEYLAALKEQEFLMTNPDKEEQVSRGLPPPSRSEYLPSINGDTIDDGKWDVVFEEDPWGKRAKYSGIAEVSGNGQNLFLRALKPNKEQVYHSLKIESDQKDALNMILEHNSKEKMRDKYQKLIHWPKEHIINISLESFEINFTVDLKNSFGYVGKQLKKDVVVCHQNQLKLVLKRQKGEVWDGNWFLPGACENKGGKISLVRKAEIKEIIVLEDQINSKWTTPTFSNKSFRLNKRHLLVVGNNLPQNRDGVVNIKSTDSLIQYTYWGNKKEIHDDPYLSRISYDDLPKIPAGKNSDGCRSISQTWSNIRFQNINNQ